MPWLHHYYCRAGFLFTSLFGLTFVTSLKGNSLLVPDSAVLVCAGLCKSKRTQGGNMVSAGWHDRGGGQGVGLKRLCCCVIKCVCGGVLRCSGRSPSNTEPWLLVLAM